MKNITLDNFLVFSFTVKQNGFLIKEERQEQGDIKFATFNSYVNACGGWMFFFILIFTMLLNIGSSSFSSWWLHMWIKAGDGVGIFKIIVVVS